ncbi:unnamed protein product [Ilex paraguariensis]|uniref:Uncharacterized protein n=1 Tax=Ilex paraguariensis TaxID=185542 RepID=A0ABC8UD94_9AQUA
MMVPFDAPFVQKNLEVGEVLSVDMSSIVALSATINVQVKYNAPMRRVVFGVSCFCFLIPLGFLVLFPINLLFFPSFHAFFSGDNLMTAVLTGPGIVFIQSMAFHRLSQRIARAVASPNMRDNPKFLIQVAIFLFLVYVVVVSSFILTDI